MKYKLKSRRILRISEELSNLLQVVNKKQCKLTYIIINVMNTHNLLSVHYSFP